MSPAELTNVAIHVTAGSVALAIGFYMLAKPKGTPVHRHWGRIFCYFTFVVCTSAIVGTTFFHFIPIFAVLSVLVPYQLISGWRSVYTQSRGPSAVDGLFTLLAAAFGIALTPVVLEHLSGPSIVVYSSLGALATILFYDAIRWLFPRRWYATLWRYEHSYKLIASIFAMLSAVSGNVIRAGQPWSQIAPSAIGVVVILYFFVQLYRQNGRRRVLPVLGQN